MPTQRPNVLLVVADSAQSGAYAVNGGEARTPHFERVVREGARFTSAYCVAPICHPARTSLFTGLYPRGHGIITNSVGNGWYPFQTLPGVESFAELLAAAGYRCGYTGQWHVQDIRGFHDNRAIPIHQYAEALRARGLSGGCLPEHSYRGCGRLSIGLEDTREAGYTREALQLMEEYAGLDQPWLIECDYDDPHPPCHVPAPYDTMYDASSMRLPPNLFDTLADKPRALGLSRRRQGTESWSNDDWRKVLAHYCASITMLDDLFGRLLAKLDELGLAQNTVVIFTSDHGSMIGAHGFLCHGSPAMFEEGLRPPLVVRWPDGVAPGTVCDEFVSHVDILPTLAELAGVHVPDGDERPLHGQSLVPFLQGREDDTWRHEVHAAYDGTGIAFYSVRVVRTRAGKLVYHAFGDHELYDMVADPHELRNRFNDPACAALKADLLQRLVAWLQRTGDPIATSVRQDFGLS